MAKKKLNSIVWPNIPNDVYYLDADKVEYDDTETYSEGSVGDALQNKANIDGSYENLTAGNAEQIVTDIRANDQTPYLFRTAGGSVDIGDREYINGIVGGTVAWNQLINPSNYKTGTYSEVVVSGNGNELKANGTASGNAYIKIFANTFPNTSGHKYYVDIPSNADIFYYDDSATRQYNSKVSPFIFSASGVAINPYCRVNSGVTVTNARIYMQVFDLTQMFGSTIADYIYSLETANAGAGVAWFKKLFPKPYYAYNAGELKSVSGLVSHDMTGFNQWDEEWEVYNPSTDNNTIISKNFCRCIPNATYYFAMPAHTGNIYWGRIIFYDANYNEITYVYCANNTVVAPSNAVWFKLCTNTGTYIYGNTYNHDICINLSWDASRDGEYEPYELHSYPLDSDLELRGIPKFDTFNNLYYDGDIYESDGAVTRKYGIVDLGSLNWLRQTNWGSINTYYTTATSTELNLKEVSSDIKANFICNKYRTASANEMYLGNDMSICQNACIRISDSTDRSASDFKASLSGVYLVYELATPTTESADPYTSLQIVNDFGTEEFVISNTVAVPIPVGHNTDYPVNLKAKVEMMPNSPDGDGDYIVRQTNGTNEYVSIANNSTISGLATRCPVASGADGTYVLKATINGGTVTYSWEAE